MTEWGLCPTPTNISVSPEPYSPEPFVLNPSSGGRIANETEAVGGVISQLPAFQQSYLQSEPEPPQLEDLLPTVVPSQLPTYRAGTAIVVHEDDGREVLP